MNHRRFIAALALSLAPLSVSLADDAPQATGALVAAAAQADVTVQLVGSPVVEIQVGEVARFELTTTLPAGGELLSMRPTGNAFVEVLTTEHWLADASQGAAASFESVLELTVYRPGRYVLEHFSGVWIDADGAQHNITGPSAEIEVVSVLANIQDATLMAPGVWVAVRTHNIVPLYLALGGLGGLIVGLLVLAARRRRRADEEEEAPAPRPPHELALEALESLERAGLVESGRHIDFHMTLSEILREFIGRRYAFHAPEMTTTEIRGALDARRRDVGAYADEILEILRESDVVKFAKFVPEHTASDALVGRVRQLVEEVAARDIEAARAEAARADDAPPVPSPLDGGFATGEPDADPNVQVPHDGAKPGAFARPDLQTPDEDERGAASTSEPVPTGSEAPSAQVLRFDRPRAQRRSADSSKPETAPAAPGLPRAERAPSDLDVPDTPRPPATSNGEAPDA